MIFAFLGTSSDVSYHGLLNTGNFQMKLYYINNTSSNGTSGVPYFDPNAGGIIVIPQSKELLAHGWVLWVAWGVLSILQLISIRYRSTATLFAGFMKRWSLIFHIVNGTIVTIATIIMSIMVFKHFEWQSRWNMSNHATFGIIMLAGTVTLAFLGYLTWGTMLY